MRRGPGSKDDRNRKRETMPELPPTEALPDDPPPPAAGPLALARDFGRYEILAELGRGGVGAVYRARDRELGRVVALKVLLAGELADDEEIRRFHREARATAALRHPNLVPIFEVGREGGFHFFTMEMIEGGDLAHHVAASQPPRRRRVEIVRKIALALQAAHEAGVLHRDVKPGNILIDLAGEPFLTDFGLARMDRGGSRVTASGVTIGTPAYMSPEQACADRDAMDARSDVYSLGAVLYELLTGRPPFEGNSLVHIIHKVAFEEPTAPREIDPRIPRALEAVCLKAMAREPGKRYPSAGKFAADLGRYLEGRDTLARPRSPVGRWLVALRRPWFLAGGAAAVALALGLLAFSRWSERPEQDAEPDTGEAGRLGREAAEREAEERARARAEAEPAFREAEEAFARADRLLYVQGDVAIRDMTAARREAIEKATAALAILPDHLDARLLRGRAYRLNRRFREAIEDFSILVRDHPELSTPYLERARANAYWLDEERTGKWRTNVHGIEFPEAVAETGEQAARRARVQEDLAVYQERARDRAKDLEVRVLLAKSAGEFERVLALASGARRGDVAEVDIVYHRALAHLFLGHASEAREDFDAVLALQVHRIEAWGYRSLARRALGDLAGALSDYDRLCELAPDQASSFNNRGMIRRALGDLRGAIEDYDRAIRLDPVMASAYSNRAIARQKIGESEGAVQDFDVALKLDPRNPMAWGGRAEAKQSLGRFEDALADIDRCLSVEPTLAVAHNNRAEILVALSRHEEALKAYRRAQELDPRYADPWGNEGKLHATLGNLPEAVRCLDRAVEIDPRHLVALAYRGRIRQQNGDLAGAEDDYSHAIEGSPTYPDLYYGRARVRADLGQREEAIQDLRRYLELAPEGGYREAAESLLAELEGR